MKKLILSLIAVAVGTLGSFAQDDLVATLSHGSNLSTFTGEDALQQAYNAAAEGDVITLSPGVFVGIGVEKAITIRGAGYKPMASNGYVSTQITGRMNITLPSDASTAFEMEGIDVLSGAIIWGDKLASVKLSKCFFRAGVYTYGIGMNAYSCIFQGLSANYVQYNGGRYISRNTTLRCNNCVIVDASSYGLDSDSGKLGKIIATNCIVNPSGSSVNYSVFINSIIISEDNNSNNYPLPATCTAQNCIGINWYETGGTPDLFQNIANPANTMLEETGQTATAKLFKTFRDLHGLSLYASFELTDAAAAQYLGDDGTQVGIYGGTSPFDPVPTNPKLKKFTVNGNASNGKLNVKINVE